MTGMTPMPGAPIPPQRSPSRLFGLRRGVIAAVVFLVMVAGAMGGVLGSEMVAHPASAQATTPSATPQAQGGDAATLQTQLIAVAKDVKPAIVNITTSSGQGSGIIYDSSGLILTNAHVVSGTKSVTVTLADGRHFTGTVVGADAQQDVAVVKINGSNLPTANLGDSSKLQVGDLVVAIGNPYGFDNTVTTGIVSALNRPMADGTTGYDQPMIQTDAAINPGNSGGALLDLQGNVVGITTLIAAPQGYPAEGLGFAIPINLAKNLADQLVNNGTVTHTGLPYLGVSLQDVTAQTQPQQGNGFGFYCFGYGCRGSGNQPPQPQAPAGVTHGALITQVVQSGPAAAAGLQAGDVITSFNGNQVYTADEVVNYLDALQPGATVELGIVDQSGASKTVKITLGETPA